MLLKFTQNYCKFFADFFKVDNITFYSVEFCFLCFGFEILVKQHSTATLVCFYQEQETVISCGGRQINHSRQQIKFKLL